MRHHLLALITGGTWTEFVCDRARYTAYECDDGAHFQVALLDTEKKAYLQLDGKALQLPKKIAYTGDRYAAGGVTSGPRQRSGTIKRSRQGQRVLFGYGACGRGAASAAGSLSPQAGRGEGGRRHFLVHLLEADLLVKLLRLVRGFLPIVVASATDDEPAITPVFSIGVLKSGDAHRRGDLLVDRFEHRRAACRTPRTRPTSRS